MIDVYGLKTCDTCKKARAWLDGKGLAHRFHDVRADGFGEKDLARWVKAAGWETLLNRRGTTWRGLGAKDKDGVDAAKATKLMLAHPALIKRPVFEADGTVVVGFGAAEQKAVSALAG